MLKQLLIYESDLCGYTEHAKLEIGRYSEKEATYPDGWKKGHNSKIHICPKCAKKLELLS